jgi:choline dehydrogenase
MRPHTNTLVLLQIGFCCAATAAETFDYVVVGGGTAGLVVANRLSENPTVRVAVIEPGGDERNNPNVTIATNYIDLKAYNTPIDWAYQTVPQVGVNNKPLIYHQGKAIGGTSAINGTQSPLPNCPYHPL